MIYIFKLLHRKLGEYPLHPLVRGGTYFCLLCATLFLGFRLLETLIIFHPLPYALDDHLNWYPPKGTDEIWFQSADGVKLNGWFIHARNQPTRGTILYCHGNSGNLTHVNAHAQQIAEYGYDVMIFDYRCYGRSEWKLPDEFGIYSDALAAYNYLTHERKIPAAQIAIYGWSLGTTAAIELASQRPCGALIVESGMSSARDMAAAMLPYFPYWVHDAGKNRFASVDKIAQVNCPVMVTHGTNDEVIPVEQGQRLFAAAREPKKLLLVTAGKHWVAGVGGKNYLTSITEFINASLNCSGQLNAGEKRFD